ncbi:MAG TPA: enolase C-terminal domain-like protein, partial [Ilumatobacteraceae bacterium]|nr:enolase C-terminal domain-like protein [Ilumatobacteraceae bacterium]
GRFGRDDAIAYADALKPYDLRWYEEPADPQDYALIDELTERFPNAIATGENLFSVQDADNLLRYGGLRPGIDVVQMDAGLSYGLTEYAAMIASLERCGFDRTAAIPHGGHLLNLHIVTGLGLGGCEAYPEVFQPFGGYSSTCRLIDGRMIPGDEPGFGLEAKPNLAVEIDRIMR